MCQMAVRSRHNMYNPQTKERTLLQRQQKPKSREIVKQIETATLCFKDRSEKPERNARVSQLYNKDQTD